MAKVKKSKKAGGKKSKLVMKSDSKKRKKTSLGLELPDSESELSDDFRAYSMLIHGEKKIGKTTTLAQEKDAVFLMCDPPQKALSIHQVQVPTWDHYIGYVGLLEKDGRKKKPKFKVATVDGIDLLYLSCFDWCCNKLVINHPNEEKDYGQSWAFIKKEFRTGILRLMRIPGMATRFIAHSKWKEVSSRGGGSFDKLVPNLTGQAEEALVGDVDIWAAYVYSGKDRVLVIKGDEETGAGHRVDHRFWTPDGRQVEEIPMGNSPAEGYANLITAFDNKQPFVSCSERDEIEAKKRGGKKKKLKLKMKKSKKKKSKKKKH